MKVKSNYVKLSLIALGIAGLFTGYNTNAFFIDYPKKVCNYGSSASSYFPTCSDLSDLHGFGRSQKSSDYNDLNSFYYSQNGDSSFADNRGIYQLTSGSYVVDTNLTSYNDGDYFTFRKGAASSFNYNFINVYNMGGTFEFAWWSDSQKRYNNVNSVNLPSIDGDDLYYYFAPWHGSFTFYNRDYLSGVKAVQYIGNKILTNYVIYVDPLDQDENVWLIDYDNLKAWSMFVSDTDFLNSLMFGSTSLNLGDYNYIDSLSWSNSYTLSLVNGSSYFYPPTDGNRVCNDLYNNYNGNGNDCKTSSRINIGFSYSSDLEFQPPHYGNGNNGSSSGSGSYVDYQKCVYDHKPINIMAKHMYSCQNTIDGEHTTNEMYEDYLYYMNNFDGSTPYSGLVRSQSCMNMLNYVKTLYSYSSGDLLDYHKRYLMAEMYADVDGFNVEELCSQHFSEDQNNQTIGFFTKIQESFNSGYNYFNVPSCSDNYYGKSYAWGNFLIIFVAGRILFILFSVF